VPLFDSPPHTLTLGLDPEFPKARSQTRRTPGEFVEWDSGVNQLELGAAREGP